VVRRTCFLDRMVDTPGTTEAQQRVNIRFSGRISPFSPVAARRIVAGSRLREPSVGRLYRLSGSWNSAGAGPEREVTESNAFYWWTQCTRFGGRCLDPGSSPEVHGRDAGTCAPCAARLDEAGTIVGTRVNRDVGPHSPIWSRSGGPVRAASRRSIPFVSDVDRVRP